MALAALGSVRAPEISAKIHELTPQVSLYCLIVIPLSLLRSRLRSVPSSRFGGNAGVVHVFDDDDATIERNIVIGGRGQYPHAVCD